MESKLITGKKHVGWYEVRQFLNGLYAIYGKTLREIEIKKRESLLDVGCGTGRILRSLRKQHAKNIELTGIDPSGDMLVKAEELSDGMDIKYKVAYANNLPFMDNTFDWVISTLTFHHIAPEVKVESVQEMVRVAKVGGKILIVDLGRPHGVLGWFPHFFSRYHAFTKGNMESVIQSLALLDVKVLHHRWQLGSVEHVLVEKMGRIS